MFSFQSTNRLASHLRHGHTAKYFLLLNMMRSTGLVLLLGVLDWECNESDTENKDIMVNSMQPNYRSSFWLG